MVSYNSINTELPNIDQDTTTLWLTRVAEGYQKRLGEINYVFVDDEEILRLNRQFIGHDYYTDHIGFDYSQGNILAGDIYISLDTVRTNAPLYGADNYQQELHRVIVHGLLHLCGIKDKTPEQRLIMEQAEDHALDLLQKKNNGEMWQLSLHKRHNP